MKKIFISYSHLDKDIVFPIVEEIERQTGQKCWIDIDGIESADEFINKITGAINTAEIIVFMHTRQSAKAKFARKEIQYAFNKQKKIILLLIDNSPLDDFFLFQFGLTDYIDYKKNEEREKFFRNIRSWFVNYASLPTKTTKDHFIVQLDKTQFNMVRVEGGTMRVVDDYKQDDIPVGDRQIVRVITLPTFYMGQFPVTQNIWEEVMGYNRSLSKEKEGEISKEASMIDYMDSTVMLSTATAVSGLKIPSPLHSHNDGKGFIQKCKRWLTDIITLRPLKYNKRQCEIGHYPVENISLDEAQEFIRRLSKLTKITFSLPTSEEWDYAARGGQHSQLFKFAGSDKVGHVAWYKGNAIGTAYPVGLKKPNELMLYDMCGNVLEWTISPDPGHSGDPGPIGRRFILRGGNWKSTAKECMISHYHYYTQKKKSGLGLRVVFHGELD